MNIYLKKKKRGQPEILSDGKYLLGPDEVFFFFCRLSFYAVRRSSYCDESNVVYHCVFIVDRPRFQFYICHALCPDYYSTFMRTYNIQI